MRDRSLTRRHFEDIYAADPDPWRFASSSYEHAKYKRTLEALPRTRYSSALDIGCSIGVLTRDLAKRCDSLLAVDAAMAPLAAARGICADHRSVRFSRMTVPEEWPTGRFDLILLSEIVYYLSTNDVAFLADRIRSSLAPRGDVLLVHWTGATDYPLSGDEAAGLLIKEIANFAHVVRRERTQDFRIDLLAHS